MAGINKVDSSIRKIEKAFELGKTLLKASIKKKVSSWMLVAAVEEKALTLIG